MELANLQFSVESRQVDEAGRSLDQLAQKADRAQKATDGLSGGSKRLSGATAQMLQNIERAVQELVQIQRAQQDFTMGLAEGAAAAIREAQALNTASGAMKGYAATSGQAVAAQRALSASHVRLADTQKVAAQAGLNLSRQLADVAVMASMGASPFQVLITQGPQLADGMALAAQSGVGLRGALGGIVAQFAPLARAMGPAIVAVGAVAATAALVADKMNDVKDEGVKTGDVLKATFQVTGAAIWDAIGPTMTKVGEAIVSALQKALAIAKEVVIAISGGFVGAYNGIRATWSMLPAVLGEAAVNAANVVIGAAEHMLNVIIRRVNAIISVVNTAARAFGLGGLAMLPEAELARLRGGGSAAAQAFSSAFSEAMREGQATARSAVDDFFRAIDEQARKNARARQEQQKAAGRRGGSSAGGIDIIPIDVVATKERINVLEIEFEQMLEEIERMAKEVKPVVIPTVELDPRGLDAWLLQMDDVLRQAEELRWTIDGIFGAIAHRDWLTAMRGLVDAFAKIRETWNKGGLQNRVTAVGSVADIMGQAIGGKTGGAISGAGQGAMSAALFTGNPLIIAGAAILGGIFGSNAAKKQEREAARQREAEAARKAAEISRQARELELQLAETTGDVLGQLNAERAAYLEGIAAENMALAEQVFALEQARQAQEQYNALFLSDAEQLVYVAGRVGDGFKSLGVHAVTSMEEFKQLADSLDRTTAAGQQLFAGLMALGPAFSQVAGYIASVQGAAASLTPFQAAQGAVSAAQQKVAAAQAALQAAIQAEVRANNEAAQAAQRVAQQFRSLADSLGRYRESLNMGAAARLSPEAEYQAARAAFEAVQGRTDADSLGRLQEASERYRAASEKYYGASLGYFHDLEKIRAAVALGEKHADKTATAAEQQVAALEAANKALTGINESVMSVAEAQEALRLAEEELRLAEEAYRDEELKLLEQIKDALMSGAGQVGSGATSGAFDPAKYLRDRPDVLREYYEEAARDAKSQAYLRQLGINSATDYATWHWETYGGGKFASGAAFRAGVVDRPTAFPMGLMGEAGPEAILPLANVGGQLGVRAAGNDNSDVVAAINGLAQRLERIEQSLDEDKAQRAAIHKEAQGARLELVGETAAARRAARRVG